MKKNCDGIQRFASLAICVSTACLLTISCASNSALTAVEAGQQATIENDSFQNLVHGRLVSENDQQPLAGATVYLPKSSLETKKPLADLSLNSAIEPSMDCPKPTEPYTSFTCTDALGHFTISLLNANLDNFKLKIQHNNTRIETQLSLNDLDSDLGTIVFQDQASDHPKSKIAIVLDLQDLSAPMSNSFEGMLSNTMKVEFEEQFSELYDIDESQYDVEFLPFPSLFEDKDNDERMDIFNYKIIYLITPGDDDLSGLSRENKKTLLEFISKGGELFVTTLSVEAEETSLDEYI